MKYVSVALFALMLFNLCGCEKHPDNCEEIMQVRITGAKNSYYVGDTIDLRVNQLPTIALFNWDRGNNSNTISGDQDVFIYPCTKADEGWYYLHVSHPDCSALHDSVYISITNKPATAPCNPDNNTATFSSLPDINFNSVTWSSDPSYNCKKLYGRYANDYPDLNIYFHQFWNNKEPEDGEYTIGNALSLSDDYPYTVYITSRYSDLLFQATGDKIYVSHVNGKLQVQFCNINLSGSYGSTGFTTTATGSITTP